MNAASLDRCLAHVGPAVAHFWNTRDAQGRNQGRNRDNATLASAPRLRAGNSSTALLS